VLRGYLFGKDLISNTESSSKTQKNGTFFDFEQNITISIYTDHLTKPAFFVEIYALLWDFLVTYNQNKTFCI